MQKVSRIKALIGLGNAGEEFANTYHNAGFLFLDHVAEGGWAPLEKSRPKAAEAARQMRGRSLTGWAEKRELGFSYQKRHGALLVKPLDYMNESGRGAAAALRYFRILPKETVVAHDDSDLPLGTAKLVFGQSGAGHHGVESVIDAFGTRNFWRLKIGIRPQRTLLRPPLRRARAGEFVLSPIRRSDRATLARLFQRASVTVMENATPLSALTIRESGRSAFSI